MYIHVLHVVVNGSLIRINMKWNYDMNLCPLNTKVKLLSSDDCLLLPRREYIGEIINNGRYLTRGKLYSGDPEYFYRSAIVAWKVLE